MTNTQQKPRTVTRIKVTGADWDKNPATRLMGGEPCPGARSKEWYGHAAHILERRSDGRWFCVYPDGMPPSVLEQFIEQTIKERERVNARVS